MIVRSYAKINLGLHILGKRQDGFHNIETIFHEIDLYDEIELEMDDRMAMTADSILIPIDATNLCLRAAILLQKEQHVKQGVVINLTKHIPIGAGLGGGSSNAAAVLCGLNKLWDLNLSNDDLRRFGAELGSDVPFFIEGKSAYATGRGEVLEHIPLEVGYWIVSVTPPIHVSTGWAYSKLKVQRNGKPTGLKDLLAKALKQPKNFNSVENDFESPVFEVYPVIEKVKKQIIDNGAVFALMSGSGSTMFGLFKDEIKARDAAASFPKDHQTSLTAPTFVPQHQSSVK